MYGAGELPEPPGQADFAQIGQLTQEGVCLDHGAKKLKHDLHLRHEGEGGG